MLRPTLLVVLGAALLACPSKVPKGLVPGAFVRLDTTGNPVVEVVSIDSGKVTCRLIPSDHMAHFRLSQIHHVEPVSPALVAQMRNLAMERHRMAGRIQQMQSGFARHVAGLVPRNGQIPKPPAPPPGYGPGSTPVDHPMSAPTSPEDLPTPSGKNFAP